MGVETLNHNQGENFGDNNTSWNNIGETSTPDYIPSDLSSEEYAQRVWDAKAEATNDIGERLGVSAEILDNPIGGSFVQEAMIGVLYNDEDRNKEAGIIGLIAEDGYKKRPLSDIERRDILGQIKRSNILSPEEAWREISNKGKERVIDGVQVDENGSVTHSHYIIKPKEGNLGSSWGYIEDIKPIVDGGVRVHRSDFSGEKELPDSEMSHIYDSEGTAMSYEFITYNEDGGEEERSVTVRDSKNPFLAEHSVYRPGETTPDKVTYGILVGSANLNIRAKADSPTESGLWSLPDDSLVIEDKNEALEYIRSNIQ